MSKLREYWAAAPEQAERMAKAERYAAEQAESLRKDAERYRWLRRADVDVDGCVLIYAEQALDDAVDAAMAEGKA